jgi:hypothetical protein
MSFDGPWESTCRRKMQVCRVLHCEPRLTLQTFMRWKCGTLSASILAAVLLVSQSSGRRKVASTSDLCGRGAQTGTVGMSGGSVAGRHCNPSQHLAWVGAATKFKRGALEGLRKRDSLPASPSKGELNDNTSNGIISTKSRERALPQGLLRFPNSPRAPRDERCCRGTTETPPRRTII